MHSTSQGHLTAGATSEWPACAGDKDQHTALAYACYFMLGSGILAPWNALITAADYFEAVFPGRHMDRLFTVAYLPVCLVLLAAMIKYNTMPERPRILTSFAGFVLIQVAVPLVDVGLVGESGTGPDSALAVLLLSVVLVGVLDGLSQGAIFADAAALPPRYTHAVVGGTASSGVIICCLRIMTKAALPATRAGLRRSTAVYFAMSGALCLACWGIYYAVLPRLGIVRYYKRLAAGGKGTVELSPPSSVHYEGGQAEPVFILGGSDDERPLVNGSSELPSDDPHHSADTLDRHCHHRASHGAHSHNKQFLSSRTSSPSYKPSSTFPNQGGFDEQALPTPNSTTALVCREPTALQQSAVAAGPAKLPGQHLAWRHVVSEAWQSAVAMFLVYVITLSIFPGVLAEDTKSDKLGSWYPIILITIFNISDLVGKNIPFCGFEPRPSTLLVLSVLRVVFVPAFLVAGKYAADVAGLMAALTVSLGFTNGLLTALLMTLAPVSVEAQEAGLVENVMVFSLVAGLTVGAMAGWLWLL